MSGLIYVFTGGGKGKTSAAIGIAVRAAGHDKRVAIFQFMKEEAPKKGELSALRTFKNVKILRFGHSSLNKSFDVDKTKEKINEGLELAKVMLENEQIDVLLLDELNLALDAKLVDFKTVEELLKYKDKNIDIIITGRNAPEEIINRADLVTEMKKIKHPFDKGVKAKKGLDY